MKLTDAVAEIRKIAKRCDYAGTLTENSLRECAEVYAANCDENGTPRPRHYMRSGEGHRPTNLSEIQWLIVRTPSFRKWFGKSVVVDENGDPKVMYHGTWRSFDEFKASSIKMSKTLMTLWTGPGFYFTDREKVAKIYAGGKGDAIYDVFLRLEKPLCVDETGNAPDGDGISKSEAGKVFLDGDNTQWLDSGLAAELARMDAEEGVVGTGKRHYKDMTRRERVAEYVKRLKTDVVKLKTASQAYGARSQRRFLEAVCRHTGHDGVIHTLAPGVKEWVVYDPKAVKSATDNDGDFSTAKAKVCDSSDFKEAKTEVKGNTDMGFKALLDTLTKFVGNPSEVHEEGMDIVDRNGRHHQPKAIPEGGQYEEEGQYLHGQAKIDAAVRRAGTGKHAALLREHVAPLFAKLGNDSATRAKIQAMHEDIRGMSKNQLMRGMAKSLQDMKRHAEAHNAVKDMGKAEFREWLNEHPEYRTVQVELLMGDRKYNKHFGVKGGFHDDGTGQQKHEAWEEAKWSVGARAMASMIVYQEMADALSGAPDAIMANMIAHAEEEAPQVENRETTTPSERITAASQEMVETATPVPYDTWLNERRSNGTGMAQKGDVVLNSIISDTDRNRDDRMNALVEKGVREHRALYGQESGWTEEHAREEVNNFLRENSDRLGSIREGTGVILGDPHGGNGRFELSDMALNGEQHYAIGGHVERGWPLFTQTDDFSGFGSIHHTPQNDREIDVMSEEVEGEPRDAAEAFATYVDSQAGAGSPQSYTDRDGNVHQIEHNEGGLKATIHTSELAAVEAEKAKAFRDAEEGVEGAEEYAHALSRFLGRGQDERSPHPGMRQEGILKHQLADKMQTRLEEKAAALSAAQEALNDNANDQTRAAFEEALRDKEATVKAVNRIAEITGITNEMLPDGTDYNAVRQALGSPIRSEDPANQEAVNALHALANPSEEEHAEVHSDTEEPTSETQTAENNPSDRADAPEAETVPPSEEQIRRAAERIVNSDWGRENLPRDADVNLVAQNLATALNNGNQRMDESSWGAIAELGEDDPVARHFMRMHGNTYAEQQERVREQGFGGRENESQETTAHAQEATQPTAQAQAEAPAATTTATGPLNRTVGENGEVSYNLGIRNVSRYDAVRTLHGQRYEWPFRRGQAPTVEQLTPELIRSVAYNLPSGRRNHWGISEFANDAQRILEYPYIADTYSGRRVMERIQRSTNVHARRYMQILNAMHPDFAQQAQRREEERRQRERQAETQAAIRALGDGTSNVSSNAQRMNVTDEQFEDALNVVLANLPNEQHDAARQAFTNFRERGQINRDHVRAIEKMLGADHPVTAEARRIAEENMSESERRKSQAVMHIPSIPQHIREANDAAMLNGGFGRISSRNPFSSVSRSSGYNCYLNDLYGMLSLMGYDVGRPPSRDNGHTARNTKAFYDVKTALVNGGAKPLVPNMGESAAGDLAEMARTKPNGTWLSLWRGGHNVSAVLYDGHWYRNDIYGGSYYHEVTPEQLAREVWNRDMVIRGARHDEGITNAVEQGLIDHVPTDDELATYGGALVIDPTSFKITPELVEAAKRRF